jgi:hypothetical protein
MEGARLSKLLELKEWLTVPEAARHLSSLFGEEIGEPDVFRLALDGHLKLSIFFVNAVRVLSVILPPGEEETKSQRQIREYFFCEGELVRGVWDLIMIGAERNYVEAVYQRLISGTELEPDAGTTWLHQDGTTCVLEPAPSFPKGSILVVRKTELEKFEKRLPSLDLQQQTDVATTRAENAALRKRIEAVLDYARNRCPKSSKTKMAEHITKQHKNQGFSPSALRQILGGRYPPMKRFNLDGLGCYIYDALLSPLWKSESAEVI